MQVASAPQCHVLLVFLLYSKEMSFCHEVSFLLHVEVQRDNWFQVDTFKNTFIHSFIHSFIPLACAECDDSLLFSEASAIPLCNILFPSTLFHQLVFHPPSLHLSFHPFTPTSLPSSLTSSCHLFLGLPLSLVVSKFIYGVFHKSLRDFRTRLRNNQDRHGRKEHINR